MLTASNFINPVIGNLSAVRGGFLGQEIDECQRIQHHLSFVCDFLSDVTPEYLNRAQRQNREQVLSVLREYNQQGEFPTHNELHTPMRAPRFIDHRGVHCAVGYLVKETADPLWSEQINAKFEYAQVRDIESDALVEWAHVNGLSLMDCAMIQPWYQPPINEWCPILMLAKDTSMETKLDIVREFRDTRLRSSASGRWVVKYYYEKGPVVVSFMQAQKWSQVPARKLLAMLIEVLESRR